MLPDKQHQAYQAFSDAARQNGTLDSRTTRLVYLAVAMAVSAGRVTAQFSHATGE